MKTRVLGTLIYLEIKKNVPSDALARVFWVKKGPKEPNNAETEKLALSLELLGTKRLLLEGPRGPGDCIFTVFSLFYDTWSQGGQGREVTHPRAANALVFGARGEP